MIDPVLQRILDDINRKLDHQHELLHNLIERQADQKDLLRDIQERTIHMSAETDHLTAAVAAETTVDASAVVLLGQLAQLIRDNATNPAALEALAVQMDTNRQSLADAITANTPVAPTPPADPADGSGAPA